MDTWKRRARGAAGKAPFYMLLVLLSLLFVFPFYWSILTSIRSNDEIFASGMSLLARQVTTEHYTRALNAFPFARYAFNTLLITAVIILSNTVFSSLAGYAFAKLDFAGKNVVYRLMLFSIMIPGTVLLIPQFLVLARFPLVGGNNWLGQGGSGFSGNFLGVVLPTAISVFNILFMRAFYITLPGELGEAARIDGASELTTFVKVYVPLSTPALATLTVFCFQAGWNSFLWPSIVLRSGDFRVLTQGLQAFTFNNNIDYGPMMAATILATVPVILIFIAAQKYFIQGIAFSGTKA